MSPENLGLPAGHDEACVWVSSKNVFEGASASGSLLLSSQ